MSCKTILPINIDEIVNLLDIAGCKRLENLRADAKKIKDLNNPETIDKRLLNNLANNYETWFFKEFERLDFRKLIKATPALYSKLATLFAIKEVLKSFELEIEVKEWFEYRGKPYHFKLLLTPPNNRDLDKAFFTKLISLIDKVKNVRSVLEGVEVDLVAQSTISIYSAVCTEVNLNKDLEVQWEENINIQSATTLDVQIDKGLDMQFACNLPNNLIGAVAWQV